MQEKYKKILEKFDKNGIFTIKGKKSGKIFSIVILTHGNEIVGLEVLKYLIEKFDIENNLENGILNFIIGNFEAFKIQERFKDVDLNRVWNFEEKYSGTYELKRALEIKDILLKSDFVLDIHSTKSPSVSFAIPLEGFDNDFLEKLEVKYIIFDIINFLHGLPLLGFVKNNNKNAKCLVLETGQHTDLKTIDLAINNVIIFLSYFGFIKQNKNLKKINKKYLKVFDSIHAKTLDVKFYYSKNPKSFDKIKNKEKIVFDGEKDIIAKKDLIILMPSIPEYIGREIGYLAQEV